MMRHYTPPLMGGMPAALMRLFLPREVADGLDIPMHTIDEEVLEAVVGVEKFFHPTVPADLKRQHFRRFATHVVELLISAELGWRRPQFRRKLARRVDDRDLRPLRRVAPRNPFPEARAGAGDERDPSFKTHVGAPFFSHAGRRWSSRSRNDRVLPSPSRVRIRIA